MTHPAERARRLMNQRPDAPADREWFRVIANKADSSAEIFIYDEIGYWGTSAADFVGQLGALDVSTINLRVNSPGGEVFDGVAIYNALKTHPATVNVSVDGLAASIASVIAMAGDTITMQRGSSMMIHDASGVAFGDSSVMRQMADLLDKLSDTIAGFYASKAGGSLTGWRDVMRAETWYNPDEAVAAGLATTAAADPPPENSAVPRHSWDLRDVLGYRYANRSEAPVPPVVPDTYPEPEVEALTGDDLAEHMQSIRDAMSPPVIELSLSELMAAIDLGTNTLPARPAPAPVSPPPADQSDPWADAERVDSRTLRQSLREAML